MKDKMKNKSIFCIVAICIVIIIAIVSHEFNNQNKAYTASYKIDEEKYDSVVENIKDGMEIEQTFVAKENNLAKIYIKFNSLKEKNAGGNVIIALKDKDGNIIKSEEMPYNYIRNNNYYEFSFKNQKESKNKEYIIYIKFLSLEDTYSEYFSINYSSQDVYKEGSMYINQEKIDGDIYFQEIYFSPRAVVLFICIIIILVLILGAVMYAIYNAKNLTPEKLFLYIVPIILFMFLELMPTFKNHDEIFHWLRIYDIAQGHFFTEMIEGKPRAIFPDEVIEIGTFTSAANIDYADLNQQMSYEITKNSKKTIITLSTTAIYNPVQYMPQALGVWIAKFFTNRPMIMAYMARIINVLVTAFILYFALKNIPFGKKILLILICLPISIEAFTSMSADGITNSVAFFFTAYVLKLFNEKDKKIVLKDKIILLISALVIALCKIVYLPLVALLLILPKDKFRTRKEQVLTIGIIMGISVIANLLWLVVSASYLVTYRDGNSKYQLMNILTHPIEYLQTLLYTINYYGRSYLYSLFGGEIGWDEHVQTYLSVPLVFGWLYTFFSVTDSDIKNRFNTYQKIIIILILLATAGLIFTSLYIQWTPLFTYDVIKGIQGRYFIPIMPLLAFAVLSNFKVKSEYTEDTKLKTIGITILVSYIFIFLTIANINF